MYMKDFVLRVACIVVSVGLAAAQNPPTVLRASTLLDGKGHILHDTAVAIENGKERPASVPYGTAVGEEPRDNK